MSYSRRFQPLATSTPNSKGVTGSADSEDPTNKQVRRGKEEALWNDGGVELDRKRTVNRRVFSSGWSLSEEEKLLLLKICNGRPVT